jgi:hypothetical protein
MLHEVMIERTASGWAACQGSYVLARFLTLTDAYAWCRARGYAARRSV